MSVPRITKQISVFEQQWRYAIRKVAPCYKTSITVEHGFEPLSVTRTGEGLSAEIFVHFVVPQGAELTTIDILVLGTNTHIPDAAHYIATITVNNVALHIYWTDHDA